MSRGPVAAAPEATGEPTGRRIADRYRLIGVLSTGGSGTVWAAFDEILGREVAIKDVVASPYLDGPQRRPVREHTLREVRAASRIDHPNVVDVYDLVEQDERPWIVMELVRAPSLAEVIRRDGPCTPCRAAHIGLRLLAALRAAHACGVIHRDVKPSNVLVNGEHAVLTDFGIAAFEGEVAPVSPGTLVGAPGYIAPECVRGRPATAASDLWSLGATIYAAVEGRPPFRRESPLTTLAAAATDEPDPIRRARMLGPLLTGLLRREPAQRPEPGQIERDLRRLITLAGTDTDEPAPAGQPVDGATVAYACPAA